MQLPGIRNQGVEEMGRGSAELGRTIETAVSATTQAFSEGLRVIGAELTKTQSMRAEARFTGGLAQLHAELDKPYLTVREVRNALGEDLSGLSSQARQFISGKDDDIVPTWVVGSEIYAAKADKLRSEAARELEWSPTAKTEFEFTAGREALARQQQLSSRYLKEQRDYQAAARTAAYAYRIDNGRTAEDFAALGADLAVDNVLTGPQKQEIATKAANARDTNSTFDAMRANDPRALQAELDALNDTAQRTSLDARQRQQLAGAVQHQLSAILGAKRDSALNQAAEDFVSSAFGQFVKAQGPLSGDAVRVDGDAILAAVEASGASAELKQRMRQLATARVQVSDARWEKKQNELFSVASSAYESKHSLSAIPPEISQWLKDPANGATDLWQKLEDRAAHDADRWRSLKKEAQDTPEQANRELAISLHMTDNPGRYREMDAATFNTLIAPNVSEKGARRLRNKLVEIHGQKVDENGELPKGVRDRFIEAGRQAGVFPAKPEKGLSLKDPSTWTSKKTPGGNMASDVYLEGAERVAAKFSQWKFDTGKPPPAEKVDQWIGEEFGSVKVDVPGTFWGTNTKTTIRADAAMSGLPSYPAMKPEEEKQIRSALEKMGLEATPANISRMYADAKAEQERERARSASLDNVSLTESDPLADVALVP